MIQKIPMCTILTYDFDKYMKDSVNIILNLNICKERRSQIVASLIMWDLSRSVLHDLFLMSGED